MFNRLSVSQYLSQPMIQKYYPDRCSKINTFIQLLYKNLKIDNEKDSLKDILQNSMPVSIKIQMVEGIKQQLRHKISEIHKVKQCFDKNPDIKYFKERHQSIRNQTKARLEQAYKTASMSKQQRQQHRRLNQYLKQDVQVLKQQIKRACNENEVKVAISKMRLQQLESLVCVLKQKKSKKMLSQKHVKKYQRLSEHDKENLYRFNN